MARPRIIIADTDINYLVPLQLKFAEEFLGKIDLEIITDPEYFHTLFVTPQKADVMVVSEDLYDSSLQRHSIGNVFLMVEQYDAEEEETGDLNVTRIFKYTSIKEIFNEIIGRSSETLRIDAETKKDPQIVLVCSAAGGVGKTTVALGLAACLTQNYKRVLYINASWLQTFQRLMKNPTAVTASDVYAKLANPSANLYESIKHVLRKELFTYLPPFKASLIALGLEFSIYEKLATSAKKSNDFDFVIVDVDSEFDNEKISLMEVADKVVIVTSQNAASVYATNAMVSNMNGASNEKYVFICNDFDDLADNALISPALTPKFSVSEYIEHITHYDSLKAEEFAVSSGMKKSAFLVI